MQINFPHISYLHSSKAATRWEHRKENQHRHYKISCRFGLDIGSGTAGSDVDFYSTLDR